MPTSSTRRPCWSRCSPCSQSGYEQVVARRDRVGDPRLRTIVSRLYYRMVNGLVDVRLEDGAGDFRVLSRTALDALLALGEANRFSKGLFAWIGFRTGYIDYRNVARAAGESTWSMRQLFDYGIDSVVSFNSKPLRLAIHVGLLITAIAVVYGGWVLVDGIVQGNRVPGYVTLICAVVGLGGLQMVLLGVIGEYLGRIYLETKQRPHFLVRETQRRRCLAFRASGSVTGVRSDRQDLAGGRCPRSEHPC